MPAGREAAETAEPAREQAGEARRGASAGQRAPHTPGLEPQPAQRHRAECPCQQQVSTFKTTTYKSRR